MVILGYIICFTLGASIGLLVGGICASASDKKAQSLDQP
jgi:hypothetical protein